MIKIKSNSYFTSRFRSIFFTLFNRIDNNNNADFHSNGEQQFLQNYFQQLRGKIALFDIGANIGGYCEILRTESVKHNLDYTIHAFEPTTYCFEVLTKNFSPDPKVILNNVGASDVETTAEIFYDVQGSGFASLYQRDLTGLNVELGRQETIHLIPLKKYIEQNSIDRIDLLKIDIEGHELKAFIGLGEYLSPKYIKAIQFEYGGANLDSHTSLHELYKILEKAGFVLAKIKKNGLEIRKYQLWMDNFQYANYVALSPELLRQ